MVVRFLNRPYDDFHPLGTVIKDCLDILQGVLEEPPGSLHPLLQPDAC
ncbi:hypothetical protein Gogos_005955, partial [Gossypium gossypioides]|nr:hypothetical protein [Gossypium gossypioides]